MGRWTIIESDSNPYSSSLYHIYWKSQIKKWVDLYINCVLLPFCSSGYRSTLATHPLGCTACSFCRFTSKPGCRASGHDWFDQPSSSSWWRFLCMSDIRACLTTNITGVMYCWGYCRELSSPCSLSDMCLTSSRSAPLSAHNKTQLRVNTLNANQASSLPTRSTETTTITLDLYELYAAAATFTILGLHSNSKPKRPVTCTEKQNNLQ